MSWDNSEVKQLGFNDPADPRIASLVTQKPSDTPIQIWGYPDDQGIWLNGGRPGARLAPDSIRQFLYKMTPDSESWSSIYDSGNLNQLSSLESRHEIALINAKNITQKNIKWISLGGGHDYGYSDAAGFIEGLKTKGQKPCVINFDAHLDVRPVLNKTFNSGTPFNRLLTREDLDFNFFEVGIQAQCNSTQHLEWAKSKGAKIISYNDIRKSTLLDSLKNGTPSALKKSPLFLSVDIDVFSSAQAPGCSQSWATGLQIDEFLEAFYWLNDFFELRALGIYEVSPPLDVQNKTSKLAALICYHALRVFNGC